MHLGTQFRARNDDDYRIMAQLGVTHVSADPPGNPHDWTRDILARHKEHVESFGLTLAMVQLPMSSRVIDQQYSPDVLMAGPRRDAQIESMCRLIETLGELEIPAAKYNMNIIGIPRTEPERGRGGSVNEAFRWERADHDMPATSAGIVDEDENWARIDHFLAHVVPTAASAKVRLACHPHDPYTPPGYRGVTRVLGTVEGLKKFVSLHESPWHGLNFCQGSIAEMLDNPREEIADVIRWFGQREKIFNVHFRNIRGGKLSFVETFPDEGDMDMWHSLQCYREVGYRHMIMPDHVPVLSGQDPANTAFAFTYGYIAALLQVLAASEAGRADRRIPALAEG